MSFTFDMPEVGEGVVEAEIAEWKVSVGDTVAVDQPLCEVTTDKASLEISSPRAGTIQRLHGEPGDIIKVHTPLVEFGEGGAAAPEPEPAAETAPAPSAAPTPAPATSPAPAPSPAAPSGPASDPATRASTRAAPAVRRRASELGIELDGVAGTGPGGRITHADLDQHRAAPVPAAPTEAPLPKAPVAMEQVLPTGAEERIKIVGIRRKIAERMVASKRTAPHFTYVEEVDCTRLVQLRGNLKAIAAERGVKLTYLAFWAKACSLAFRDFPNVNAWMLDETNELVVKGDHHIGIATDSPSGLMVPVVRNVEQKSVLRIAADIADVTSRARAGKASRDELMGSTFTITGVGNIGGVLATPILNVPEVGILGVNQIKKRPVVLPDDTIGVRHMTMLSPSFDHRIIDGAVAARFVRRLKEIVENPDTFVLELS